MQVQPVAFSANGIVGTAAFTGTITGEFGGDFQPAYLDSDSVNVPQQAVGIVGLAFTGFTKVVIYNGSDNTGDVVVVATAPGTLAWDNVVNFNKGAYVEVTGTGKGTVWLA